MRLCSNSSPMKPRRRSQQRKVYFGLSVTGLVGLADLVVSACALMARQRWMYALIFPAWSVPLKARNSMVRAGRSVEKAAWRLSRW